MSKYLAIYGIALFLLFVSGRLLCAQNPGAALYAEKCQMCHAPDGSGDNPAGKAMKARSFTLPEVRKESDAELATIIKNGKNKMPSFAGKLTDPQIAGLIAYIHTLQKKQ